MNDPLDSLAEDMLFAGKSLSEVISTLSGLIEARRDVIREYESYRNNTSTMPASGSTLKVTK